MPCTNFCYWKTRCGSAFLIELKCVSATECTTLNVFRINFKCKTVFNSIGVMFVDKVNFRRRESTRHGKQTLHRTARAHLKHLIAIALDGCCHMIRDRERLLRRWASVSIEDAPVVHLKHDCRRTRRVWVRARCPQEIRIVLRRCRCICRYKVGRRVGRRARLNVKFAILWI